MCLKTDSGFTLLELMLSIVIMGIMLGMGMAFFSPSSSGLGTTAKSLAGHLSTARVDAMLGRRKVCLQFEGDRLFRLDGDAKKTLLQRLPEGTGLAVDGKAMMMNGKERFVFGSLGYTTEKYIILHDGRELQTVYVPSIGAPVVKPGMADLEELRKATQ